MMSVSRNPQIFNEKYIFDISDAASRRYRSLYRSFQKKRGNLAGESEIYCYLRSTVPALTHDFSSREFRPGFQMCSNIPAPRGKGIGAIRATVNRLAALDQNLARTVNPIARSTPSTLRIQ